MLCLPENDSQTTVDLALPSLKLVSAPCVLLPRAGQGGETLLVACHGGAATRICPNGHGASTPLGRAFKAMSTVCQDATGNCSLISCLRSLKISYLRLLNSKNDPVPVTAMEESLHKDQVRAAMAPTMSFN